MVQGSYVEDRLTQARCTEQSHTGINICQFPILTYVVHPKHVVVVVPQTKPVSQTTTQGRINSGAATRFSQHGNRKELAAA